MKDIKEIVTKLVNVEKEVSSKKGSFNLFALFLREGSENRWDLLVASEWTYQNKYESLKYIGSIIQKALTQEDLIEISGIEVIDYNNPALDEIYRTIKGNVEHSIVEISNFKFFGITIQHAYIITAKRAKSMMSDVNWSSVKNIDWLDTYSPSFVFG